MSPGRSGRPLRRPTWPKAGSRPPGTPRARPGAGRPGRDRPGGRSGSIRDRSSGGAARAADGTEAPQGRSDGARPEGSPGGSGKGRNRGQVMQERPVRSHGDPAPSDHNHGHGQLLDYADAHPVGELRGHLQRANDGKRRNGGVQAAGPDVKCGRCSGPRRPAPNGWPWHPGRSHPSRSHAVRPPGPSPGTTATLHPGSAAAASTDRTATRPRREDSTLRVKATRARLAPARRPDLGTREAGRRPLARRASS